MPGSEIRREIMGECRANAPLPQQITIMAPPGTIVGKDLRDVARDQMKHTHTLWPRVGSLTLPCGQFVEAPTGATVKRTGSPRCFWCKWWNKGGDDGRSGEAG